jgi:hypothetical protein
MTLYLPWMRVGDKCTGCGKDFADRDSAMQHIKSGACSELQHFYLPEWPRIPTNASTELSVQYKGAAHTIERVQSFAYLGRVICANDSDFPAVRAAIAKGWAVVHALRHNVFTRHLSTSTRLRIFNTVVIARVLYCCETWSLTASIRRALDAFQQKGLRHVLKLHPTKHGTHLHYPKRVDVLHAAGDVQQLSSQVYQRGLSFFRLTQQLRPTSLLRSSLESAVIGTSNSNTHLGSLYLSWLAPSIEALDDLSPAAHPDVAPPDVMDTRGQSHTAPTGG